MNKHGGYREGGGRPKGSKNKRTLDIEKKINEFGCPFEGMARIASKAEEHGEYATAGRIYSELASYLRAKPRSASPQKPSSPLQGMTLEQLGQLKASIIKDGTTLTAH